MTRTKQRTKTKRQANQGVGTEAQMRAYLAQFPIPQTDAEQERALRNVRKAMERPLGPHWEMPEVEGWLLAHPLELNDVVWMTAWIRSLAHEFPILLPDRLVKGLRVLAECLKELLDEYPLDAAPTPTWQ